MLAFVPYIRVQRQDKFIDESEGRFALWPNKDPSIGSYWAMFVDSVLMEGSEFSLHGGRNRVGTHQLLASYPNCI